MTVTGRIKFGKVIFSELGAGEQAWLQKACTMPKFRTGSGKFRMRKVREAYNRMFGASFSYDQMRALIYGLCDTHNIPRAKYNGRGHKTTHVPVAKESVMDRLARYESELMSMRSQIAELTTLIKG